MSSSNSFLFVIEDEDGHRKIAPIGRGETRIGRAETSGICLPERNVSREHARVALDESGLWTEDLDSFNGLWVNGHRVEGRRTLALGDVLRVGDFRLELCDAANLEEPTDSGVTHPGFVHRLPAEAAAEAMAASEPTQTLARALGPDPAAAAAAPPYAPVPVPGDLPRPEAASAVPAAASSAVPAAATSPASASLAAEPPPSLAAASPPGPTVLPVAQRPHLLCVSTAFAGQLFEVGRSEATIGRVAQNDVGIDHRSVSRHHAKLITHAGRVVVVDLQSANGTFVNGEPYAQTELKPGDLVELGHVRLRFVAPGETYTPTTAEQVVIRRAKEQNSHSPRRRLLQGGLGMAVVGGAIFAGLRLSGGPVGDASGDGGEGAHNVAVTTGPQSVGAARETPAGSASGPPGEVATLLAQTQSALDEKQPRRAQIFLGAALALEPQRPAAQLMQRRIDQQLHDEHSLALGRRAEEQKNLTEAQTRLQEIGRDSVFYPEASEALSRVVPALAGDHLRACRTALAADALAEAQVNLDAAAALDPGHRDIPAMRSELEEARRRLAAHRGAHPPAAPAAARPKPARAAAAPPPAPPPAAPATAAVDDVSALYTEGLKAFHAGQMKSASDAFARCAAADPKDKAVAVCLRALGILYAKQGDGPRAVRYYRLYLKAEPNSPDAPQVQDLLRQYEKSH